MQRSLSAEDLYQRFQKNQSKSQPTNQDPQNQKPFDNLTSSPPPPLRDLEALKTYRFFKKPPLPRTSIKFKPLRPILSLRLPNPPVFNDTDRSKFEDWKLRIQDKLLLNRDHYFTDAFQINYVISRLAEKASEHTIFKRRNSITSPYNTAKDVLNQLNDLYKTPLYLLQKANAYIYEELKQRKQSFSEFYTEFMRYAADDQSQSQKRHLIRCLKNNITKKLRETHMMMSTERD